MLCHRCAAEAGKYLLKAWRLIYNVFVQIYTGRVGLLVRHCFMLTLVMCVLAGEILCAPLSEEAATGQSGSAANEDVSALPLQERDTDDEYSGAAGYDYDEKDILEEEFPEDEWEEEGPEGEASGVAAPESKRQSTGT